MDVDYTLFNNAGDALRAKVTMELAGYMASDEERKKYPKNSPDMSRLVTVKDGDTLAALLSGCLIPHWLHKWQSLTI